jgi:AP2 domain
MSRPSKTPGVCRIDQPSHRTHGFFVRVQRQGKIYSAFFTDLKYGGKAAALTAAKHFHRQSVVIFGPPAMLNRQWWAEIVRRKGRSGIHGVQKVAIRRAGKLYSYWCATWSKEPYVARRRMFSIRKYGASEAKQLAIRARRAGVRSMKP